MSSLPSPDDGHGQTHGGVKVAPGDPARGADADHQGQAVAEGDVEEASEEIVTSSCVSEDNLGHRAVTKENQEKRPEQLGQENFHKPVTKWWDMLSGDLESAILYTYFLFWFSYIACCLTIGFGVFTL